MIESGDASQSTAYLVFDGFIIKNTGGSSVAGRGIVINDSNHIETRNLESRNGNINGLFLMEQNASATDITLEYCVFRDTDDYRSVRITCTGAQDLVP